MDYRILLLLICLSGLYSGPILAESPSDSVYISDMLRVGVRPEPDSRSTPIGVVTTGMQLKVLGQRDGYLRIETDKGLTGWIREIYAIETPPAMIQLERLEKVYSKTQKELDALRQNVEVLEEANQELNSQLDQVKAERSKLQLRLAKEAFNQKQDSNYWIFWVIGLLLIGLGAFAGGVIWQRRQVARRLGGLRL